MQAWSILAGVVALAGCPGNGSQGGGAAGSAATCEALRPKIESMYRAEAQAKEPGRVEDAVADNTTMVMNDCAKAPDKVIACVNRVSSVPDLEKRCLAPLDEEGSEGDALRR